MNKLVLSAVAAACLSSTAFAATSAAASTAAPGVSNGIVLGVQGGYVAQQVPSKSYMGANSRKQTNFGGGAYAGYLFAVNPNILVGPTLGYDWLGNTTYKYNTSEDNGKVKLTSQAVSLLAKGMYVFNSGFNIAADAGFAYVMQKDAVHGSFDKDSDDAFSASGSKTYHAYDPEAGFGLGYTLDNGLNLGANFNYIFGEKTHSHSNKPYSVAALMADVSYKFD